MKKIVCIIISILLVCCFCGGCGNTENNTPQGSVEVTKQVAKDIVTGEELYLVNNFSSKYKIIIPSNSSKLISFASNELQTLINKSCGFTLPIVSDAGMAFDNKTYYISIGETALKRGAGVKTDNLAEETAYVKTVGNNVILTGGGDYGSLHAVYDFLTLTVEYEAYSYDELYVKEMRDIKIYQADNVNKPDILGRSVGLGGINGGSNIQNATKMRLRASGGSGRDFETGATRFGFWTHTIDNHNGGFFPKNKYAQYFGNGQLCLYRMLNEDDSFDVFIAALYEWIDKYSTSNAYQIGMGDNPNICGCDGCKQLNTENGGAAGPYMMFLNKVAERVNQDYDRTITISALPYLGYKNAPAVYDEATKKYKPVNDNVVAGDNVTVMYAPIYRCYNHSLSDSSCEINQSYYRDIQGWAACTSQLEIYTYCSNFDNYFLYYNDFGGLKEDVEVYKSNNVVYLFDEGGANDGGNFLGLRKYLRSKLYWDSDFDVNTLTVNFFKHYYKDASDIMLNIFNSIRMHYAVTLAEQAGTTCVGCYNSVVNYSDSKYWTFDYLSLLEEDFNKAFAAIENSALDSETKQKVKDRILEDSLTTEYMLLNYYPTYFSNYNERYQEMLANCARLGILYTGEAKKLA